MEQPDHPIEILHIEDSLDDAFLFQTQLREVSLEIGRVTHVTTLAAAISKLRAGDNPDLVFLDLSLPDAWELDGLEALLEVSPHLIVVVLTGRGDEDLPLRALKAGAQDYMSKQELSAEMLARIIRFALYRAQSQEVLRAAVEEAKRANVAKSRFLANIGHELRTPLNVIMGFTDLFASEVQDLPEPERRQVLSDLRTVSKAQSHLLDLLNDLIDMAKMESTQFRLEPSVFSLHQLIESVTALFRDTFLDRGNRFSCELRGDLPEELFADPRRIRQLLVNLLSNANKFTENGRIDLTVECRPAIDTSDDAYELVLEVKDSGIGIRPEDQQRIFEYFQQVDDSSRRPYDGSGLGLTICRQLAHMMGGEVTVESEPGEGSTFTVVLKVAPAQLQAVPETEEDPESNVFQLRSTQNRRALVIEDEPESRRFVGRALQALGLEVTSVNSAEEAALALVGGDSFDFVIVDLHLPGKDGLDLVKALRRTTSAERAPHVIVATGDRSEIVRERCEEEGIVDVLFKPFAPDALCRRIIDRVS